MPKEITPHEIDIARHAAAAGLNHRRIANYIGVPERSFYRLKKHEPRLASAIDDGLKARASRCRSCGQPIRKGSTNHA